MISDANQYCACVGTERKEGLEKYLNELLQVQKGVKGAAAEQAKIISQNADVLAFLGCSKGEGGYGEAQEPMRVHFSVASGNGGFELDDGLFVTSVEAGGEAADAGVGEGEYYLAHSSKF